MIMRSWLIFCLLLITPVAFAKDVKILVENKPEVFEHMIKWGQEIATAENAKFKPFVSCRPSHELPGNVYFCLSFGSEKDLFPILGRISIFSEGNYGYPTGTLVDRNSEKFKASTSQGNLLGYNIKGQEIVDFRIASNKACNQGEEGKCLTDVEKQFYSAFENQLKDPDFTLIAATFFPMVYGDAHVIMMNHEGLHVIYFNDDNFRNIVDTFWKNSVSAEDKELVKKKFDGAYDASNDYVVINEFQAYVLQMRPEVGMLPEIALKYRENLKKALGLSFPDYLKSEP